MVDALGLAIGVGLTLVVVLVHFTKGTEWPTADDVSQEVMERRAATVPETDFPEPMNRSIGGGAAAGAVATGDGAEGELAEGEEEAAGDESPAAIPDEEAEAFEVEYVKEGETIEVKENETLLEAGEEEGWDLPYACREGQCISCSGRIASGEHAQEHVEHFTQSMFEEGELEQGYVLTCVAYPTTDFTLETGESP